jgi:WD40 repeat protein
LEGHCCVVYDVVWSSDGQLLLSVSEDGTVNIWNPLRQELISSYLNKSNGYTAVWSPDATSLLGTDAASRIYIFATDSGEPVRTLEGHANAPRGLSWKPDGRLVASGGDDHSVKLWDPTPGGCLATFFVDAMPLSLAFAPQSNCLAACDSGGNVHVFEIGNEIMNGRPASDV